MKTLKKINTILFFILFFFLLNGCVTALYYDSTCGRCCSKLDKSVELKSSFLDEEDNLIINFKAELGEEKEVGDYHIILNLQEIIDTINKNYSKRYTYNAENSKIERIFKGELDYWKSIDYISIYLNRNSINNDILYPVNGINVIDSIDAEIYQSNIFFTFPPPPR